MNYWLVCLPRQDIEHCIKVGIFGLSRRNTISRVVEGDKVVLCATKEWAVLGMGEVTSDYYVDDAAVFLKPGVFPDRFKFAAKLLPAPQACLKDLLANLSCVKRLDCWPVYFKNCITAISAKDWDLITEHVKGVPVK